MPPPLSVYVEMLPLSMLIMNHTLHSQSSMSSYYRMSLLSWGTLSSCLPLLVINTPPLLSWPSTITTWIIAKTRGVLTSPCVPCLSHDQLHLRITMTHNYQVKELLYLEGRGRGCLEKFNILKKVRKIHKHETYKLYLKLYILWKQLSNCRRMHICALVGHSNPTKTTSHNSQKKNFVAFMSHFRIGPTPKPSVFPPHLLLGVNNPWVKNL